jgi:hypothetical protein
VPLLEAKDLPKSCGDLEVMRGVNRPLVVGVVPAERAFPVLMLLGYAAVALHIALVFTRRQSL